MVLSGNGNTETLPSVHHADNQFENNLEYQVFARSSA
jgi:hypothetical protein